MSEPRFICKACGYHGEVQRVTKGSFAIELLLWLCFLIPGLLYSLWRLSSRYSGCPKCGSADVIPLDTPLGSKLLAEVDPQAHAVAFAPRPPQRGVAWVLGRWVGRLFR